MTLLSRRDFAKGSLAAGLVAAAFPARAAGLDELTLQANWLNDPEFIGYMIGIDGGFYKQAGLLVRYLPGGPDLSPESALLAGKADIALTAMPTTAKVIGEMGAKLKIIGTQYQKSPLGVISLEESGIRGPNDLVGKTVAVPALAMLQFRTLLKANKIDAASLRIVPFSFDSTPLINKSVDSVVDFVTQLPFMLEIAGHKATSFLFYDFGLPLYINLVVVREETLAEKRSALVRFLKASRLAWIENFKDPARFPTEFHETWFRGTGGLLEAEIDFNRRQENLMAHEKGFFFMDEKGIERNLETLGQLGIKADRSMFDTTLLADL